MGLTVAAGARLDGLPISSFHYRIFWLVVAGMFFDGYDLYIAGGVLASAIQTKFTTAPQNLQFISLTFVGMTIGSLITGFVGDKVGRRFTYQVNLLIFGLASLAAAFAQDTNELIACRFVQGLRLGAEIVVGYSRLTQFVPPQTRGPWLSMIAFLAVRGVPVTPLRPLFLRQGLAIANSLAYPLCCRSPRWSAARSAPICPMRSDGAGASSARRSSPSSLATSMPASTRRPIRRSCSASASF